MEPKDGNDRIWLNGDWDFAYTRDLSDPNDAALLAGLSFECKMPVPGYWDDHLEGLRKSVLWSTAKFNPNFRHIDYPMGQIPPDPSLPFLFGVGWYRKQLDALPELGSHILTLHVGGVRMEAWVWVNGQLAKHHLGHSTHFELELNHWLTVGGPNELVVAVSNTRNDRSGSVVRGYQDRSGGIWGPVCLKISGRARIASCYVRPGDSLSQLAWKVDLRGDVRADDVLHWLVREPGSGEVLGKGQTRASGGSVEWTSSSFGVKPWSDHHPRLYEAVVYLQDADNVLDSRSQPFGLRKIEAEGTGLKLNGEPIMLRGVTDFAYYPTTCTPPGDVESYRGLIRQLKKLGFNWIRCHTWMPNEQFLQAADELGMMFQVEAPVERQWVQSDEFVMEESTGTVTDAEWIDILKTCRIHPSVVLYCCGNEEILEETKIAALRNMAALCRKHVPDALFDPHEALRGIEFEFNSGEFGDGVVCEPFPHNATRLAAVKEFSDVLGAFAHGYLSYIATQGDWRELYRRLAIYEKPVLSHEIGILGTYLDLDLELRYEGTRTGTELFTSVRRYLSESGLLDNSSVYFRNSCAWASAVRKYCVEMARKCNLLAGYDYLGAIDQHCNRSGYTCGIMNEFYEIKPGESTEDVLKYNGESVILLDHGTQRNLLTGQDCGFDVMVSLFGRSDLEHGVVAWHLAGTDGTIYQRGEISVSCITRGSVSTVGRVEFSAPELEIPGRVTLHARLSGGDYEIRNDWCFWVFPDADAPLVPADADEETRSRYSGRYSTLSPVGKGRLRVLSALDADAVEFLSKGGRVVLLGSGPFPALPTSFQISTAGRAGGNLATVIADHPLTLRFPHDGYCDWQFHPMLEGSRAVVFNEIDLPFDPIIEVVSSYKMVLKQAALFEMNVGEGQLLVCSMRLDTSDPAARYLLDSILSYAAGSTFRPRWGVSPDAMAELLNKDHGQVGISTRVF